MNLQKRSYQDNHHSNPNSSSNFLPTTKKTASTRITFCRVCLLSIHQMRIQSNTDTKMTSLTQPDYLSCFAYPKKRTTQTKRMHCLRPSAKMNKMITALINKVSSVCIIPWITSNTLTKEEVHTYLEEDVDMAEIYVHGYSIFSPQAPEDTAESIFCTPQKLISVK